VPALALSFLNKYAQEEQRGFQRFSSGAEAALLQYSWPGNVRELENVVRQLVVMHEGIEVTEAMLATLLCNTHTAIQSDITVNMPETAFNTSRSIQPLWFQEKQIIETTLETFDGNIALAAAALEISPSTIYRKKQSWAERCVA